MVLTARVPARAEAVARLIAVARTFAETARLPPTAADRLAVIVEEWAANIVEHGAAAPTSLIVLRLDRTGGAVGILFSDAGVAFDPRTVEENGPNLERGGGAGIAMIRFWSRLADYRRRGGRNRLMLVLDVG